MLAKYSTESSVCTARGVREEGTRGLVEVITYYISDFPQTRSKWTEFSELNIGWNYSIVTTSVLGKYQSHSNPSSNGP